jgi:hypothetical protein
MVRRKIAGITALLWHSCSMRRQIRTAALVAFSSVVVTGCGATVRSAPQSGNVGAVEGPPTTVGAPTNPAPLPFRFPCGESDLEGCTKGCAEKVTEDCTTLGVIYYEGKGIAADATRGIEIFRSACLEDSARACDQGLRAPGPAPGPALDLALIRPLRGRIKQDAQGGSASHWPKNLVVRPRSGRTMHGSRGIAPCRVEGGEPSLLPKLDVFAKPLHTREDFSRQTFVAQ